MIGAALDSGRPFALARAEVGGRQQLGQRHDPGQRRTDVVHDAVRADAAGLVLQHEPFSPRRLAEAVGAARAARAGNKGIKTEIAFAPALPAMVAGDALRLRAALENLADNAVKFTSEAVSYTHLR